MIARTFCFALLALALPFTALAKEIGYVETFSLAEDREAALKQLIPGTDEYYYYHCLHYQNTGNRKAYDEFMGLWIKRRGYTTQVKELRNRQALLDYPENPAPSLAHITKELNLRFDHRRVTADQVSNAPTRLDNKMIGVPALLDRAFKRHKNLHGIEDAGLHLLAEQDLNPDRRRDLLHRLRRPDYPGLVNLVIADLEYKNSGGFGSHPVHGMMLLDQLDACARRMPKLLNQQKYVEAYLPKLRPSDDVNPDADPAAQTAYYDRLWAFASRLDPVHNSLKACILYNRLDHDRGQGIYDADRFLEYVKLPRNAVYARDAYLNLSEHRNVKANMNADYRQFASIGVVRNDEPLVRDFLSRFLVEAADTKPYDPYLRDTYLKQVFAETKILNGVGDSEQWASMLTPQQFKALKDRVDLDFVQANTRIFAPQDPVRLELDVKNVKSLLVKVYEINTINYYREQQREVDLAVNLDGLVATHEHRFIYEDPPLHRVRRAFEFPELANRGVYVVEFIGNGKSSRSLIHKGRLHFVQDITPAGHAFTVLDEENNHLKEATVWMAGRAYEPGEDGVVLVPFSTAPNNRQAAILQHGGFGTRALFHHLAETYQLAGGFYVDREALLRREKAAVMVRPILLVSGEPSSLSLLEEVRLSILSVDLDGVETSKDIPGFELFEDREATFDFQVPEKLASISFVLSAKVQNVSGGKKQDLSLSRGYTLNAIDSGAAVDDVHISMAGDGYVAELLGKNGERKAGKPLYAVVKHRFFKEHVNVSLQTDDAGQCGLGALKDIAWIKVKGPDGHEKSWSPSQDWAAYPNNVHGVAGETVRIPYLLDEGLQPPPVSLLETIGGQFVNNRQGAVGVQDGFIEIKDLPAGDYDLRIGPDGPSVHLRLTEGKGALGHALSPTRLLKVRNPTPLQIASIATADDAVTIRVANADDLTRVHVVATRFRPEYSLAEELGATGLPEPVYKRVVPAQSLYVSGRKIGEEYRYILDRQAQPKYPGNMLERPALLLNPWSLRTTKAAVQTAAVGDELASVMSPELAEMMMDAFGGAQGGDAGAYASLDFLANPATLLANLEPDKDGVVRVDRKKLGAARQVRVLAVNHRNSVLREIALPDGPCETRELRLANGLDPESHFTERKLVSTFGKGDTFQLEDILTSTYESYDTLGKVYRLMSTLTGNTDLSTFSFILNWPKMEEAEKQKKYSEHACHELSFFIYRKDPRFFKEVVRPYLENKKDKTFMDRWLIDDDLAPFLEPSAFKDLNAAERILLGQRIRQQQASLARHTKERFDLIPPDIERFNRLFDTAVKGSALETEGYFFALGELMDAEMEALATELPAAGFKGTPVAFAGVAVDGKTKAASGRSAGLRRLAATAEADFGDQVFGDADMDGLGVARNLEKSKKSFAYRARYAERKELHQHFRQLDKTEEYAENNYYHLPIEQQNADLIKVNAFWNDVAARGGERPFLSGNFLEATSNFAEMMLALSMLDLPFEPGKNETAVDGRSYRLKAADAQVIFHKEIQPAAEQQDANPILVTQNFFRADDRYTHVNNERYDKYVTGEFLQHVVYGCQVILTNPTSTRQKLNLLLQIPRGAVPVNNGFYTRGIPLTLEPYSTQTFEYAFYFPGAGQFAQFPVHVAKHEQLVGHARAMAFNVVEKLSKIDTTSWDYISQNGTPDEVLTYLADHNLNRLDLAKIAFRVQDKAFFRKVIDLLDARHHYHHTLWSYGIRHNDLPTAREYLTHSPYAGRCGDVIDTALLTVDPVSRRTYQHLEYSPFVNARAHRLGARWTILNDRLYEQYHRTMKVLTYKAPLGPADRLAAAYYLLLQDRIEEGLAMFDTVEADRLPTRLQYDYVLAYVSFYRQDLDAARAVATRHRDEPVVRWRNRFANVLAQLDEVGGKAAGVVDEESREQKQDELAATEPALDFKVEGRTLHIDYRNLPTCRINYYPMDIEMLFSRNPFVKEQSAQFGFIRPRHSQEVALPEGATTLAMELPEQFHSSNVMLEITAGGLRKTEAVFAHSLSVQIIENYGQAKITHEETKKPLSKVYVKVYARTRGGQVKFYKDGYTDLRGRFDYVSLNTNELDDVERFSLLILSDDGHGAVIREAAPPKR